MDLLIFAGVTIIVGGLLGYWLCNHVHQTAGSKVASALDRATTVSGSEKSVLSGLVADVEALKAKVTPAAAPAATPTTSPPAAAPKTS